MNRTLSSIFGVQMLSEHVHRSVENGLVATSLLPRTGYFEANKKEKKIT